MVPGGDQRHSERMCSSCVFTCPEYKLIVEQPIQIGSLIQLL